MALGISNPFAVIREAKASAAVGQIVNRSNFFRFDVEDVDIGADTKESNFLAVGRPNVLAHFDGAIG